jgi:hypothetical protein
MDSHLVQVPLLALEEFEQSCHNLFVLLTRKKNDVTTPLWAKCENATHIPKSGKMESSRTPKNSEDNLRGQISLLWCDLYINEKVLKRRCPKWPCIGHLDICSQVMGKRRAGSQTTSLTPDH